MFFNNSAGLSTGEQLNFYFVSAIMSFVMLLIFFIKRKNYNYKYAKASFIKNLIKKHVTLLSFLFLIILNVLPIISTDVETVSFNFDFESSISLNDKLVVSYDVDETVNDLVVNYNKRAELPTDPQKIGYKFDKWVFEDGTTFDPNTPITEDIKLKAEFSPIKYTIDYDLKGGSLPSPDDNPVTYTIEDEINLAQPTKEGYTFTGWTGANGNSPQTEVKIEKGSTGDKNYTANWTVIPYRITYDLDGGTLPDDYPTSYTIKSETFTLKNPTKDGYEFTGWTGTDLQTKTKTVTIPKNSTGDREYTAHWAQEVYSITYNNIDGATVDPPNPVEYDVEDEIHLTQPEKTGYEFTGWTGTELTEKTISVTIPQNSTGHRVYEAHWDLKNYSITYNNIDGAAVSPANKTQYNIETETFTLNNPTKDGYTFTGWTGSNGNEPQTTVTISKGSTENKEYTAHWEPKTYTINYILDGGTVDPANPTSYTIETEDFTLINPTKDGYTFTGWTGSNGTVPQTEVTISKGSTENKEYTAHWSQRYTITYNLDGGTVSSPNPTEYYKETATFTLTQPTKNGYTFTGWTGTGLSEKTKDVIIPQGSTGNRVYTANWETKTYSITYNLDGGTVNPANPTSYTIESETITLNKPTKEGLRFKGWTGSNGETPQPTVTIPQGSTGDRTYTAHWTDEYTIIFHSNNGQDQTRSQIVKFDQQVQLNPYQANLEIFTNGSMVFKEWTTNPDGSGVKYVDKAKKDGSAINIVNLPVDENLEVHLYTQWQEPNLTKTTLDKGANVNVKMKKLAGNNGANVSSFDTNIHSIKRATQEQYNSAPSNKVDVTSTYAQNYLDKKIWMWFVEDNENEPGTGTIYYYSDADIIYLNETNNQLFYRLNGLKSVELTGIDSSIVKNMESMFGECLKLETLDLTGFNTSSANSMQYMFNQCESLTSLNLSSFNTCQVNTMRNMFSSCKSLQTLNLSNFNTFNVKNMQKMFDDMYKIETLDLSSFDTRNATLMNEMFETTK